MLTKERKIKTTNHGRNEEQNTEIYQSDPLKTLYY